MNDDQQSIPHGLLALPVEILLHIFDQLSTAEVLPSTLTCRSLLSVILRLLHGRLISAATLVGYTLYLECHHPSARLTAEGFFCTRLESEIEQLHESDFQKISLLRRLRTSYTRFCPQKTEPRPTYPRRHPAGDVRGSRTFVEPATSVTAATADTNRVTETVTIEASDLFTQLTTRAYLGKREPRRGLLVTIHELVEGTIRVWRDWLSKHCESRSFQDGSTIHIQEETMPDMTIDSSTDPRILWVNKGNNSLGVRLRIKSRSRLSAMPIIYTSDVELPVSYSIEFEEVIIRTSHLLMKLEEAEAQLFDGNDRAVVFGTITQA